MVRNCIELRLRSVLTCWANNSFVPRRQFLSLFRGAPACVSQNSSRQTSQSGSPTRRITSLVLFFCFTSFAFALPAPEPPYISRCQASSLKTVRQILESNSSTRVIPKYQPSTLAELVSQHLQQQNTPSSAADGTRSSPPA